MILEFTGKRHLLVCLDNRVEGVAPVRYQVDIPHQLGSKYSIPFGKHGSVGCTDGIGPPLLEQASVRVAIFSPTPVTEMRSTDQPNRDLNSPSAMSAGNDLRWRARRRPEFLGGQSA